MPASFKLHRTAAFIVLIGASAWILTGEFSSVGSAEDATGKENHKPEPAVAEMQTAAAPTLRTVAVKEPAFVDHARRIRLSGTTGAGKRVVLAARADGVISALDLVKGAAVAESGVVMTLEGPETLAQAEIAAIALAQRDRELVVAERLYSGGNTPEVQLTSARSDRDAARAELNRANAAVDRLELKAPFAGIVETVDVELGAWVQTGAPVATILSLDPILVNVEISEVDVGSVAQGSKARVTLVTGAEMEGVVRLVSREASAETRTFPVEIVLPNPGNSIPSGMSAEVELLTDPVRAVAVPRSVITLADSGELGVRVVADDDIAHFVPVGIIDDTETGLVVTGVPDGVRIIVAGQDLVRDGDKVAVATTGISE
ncbi:MAG: efflux RND transporter periplasmic adaptor subunit [Paracoccaceae bacterium]